MSYVWTNEQPTVPGIYWNRLMDGDEEEREPIMVRVTAVNGVLYCDELSVCMSRIMGPLDVVSGQWAGPIDEPKEA